MPGSKLTKRLVERTEPGAKDIILRDSEIRGFQCKITPKGRRVYLLYYRTREGQERRPVIGVHGDITCEQARQIAQQWKAEVAKGGDPSRDRHVGRQTPTVKELCARYLEEHAKGRKKASSVKNDKDLVARFVVPHLGSRKVTAVTPTDVQRLHNSLRDTPYQANRALALLSKMFNLAEAWGLRVDGSNPTRHVPKFKEEKRERYLSDTELARLGEVLDEVDRSGSERPESTAAIRLLLLTGCRLNEILTLRFQDIDRERGLLRFADTKTGRQVRPIGRAALDYIKSLPWRDENPFVVPGRQRNKPLVNLSKPWRRIREKAGLAEVRIHDLRHTHASAAAGLGLSLPMIGALLGHTQAGTTQRYAHLANNPLTAAADAVSGRIIDRLEGAGVQ